MSARRPSGVTLDALAERVCTAAGTDLAAVLADLRGGSDAPETPDAIRAGWAAPDATIPDPTQEPA